jgi:hypothetical protein
MPRPGAYRGQDSANWFQSRRGIVPLRLLLSVKWKRTTRRHNEKNVSILLFCRWKNWHHEWQEEELTSLAINDVSISAGIPIEIVVVCGNLEARHSRQTEHVDIVVDETRIMNCGQTRNSIYSKLPSSNLGRNCPIGVLPSVGWGGRHSRQELETC